MSKQAADSHGPVRMTHDAPAAVPAPDPFHLPAPFRRFEGAVRPEWIDGNGHMNLAYYVVLFDQGVDALFDAVGFGAAYRDATACGPFAVETHTLYERELRTGERVRVASLIVGCDAKRLHVAHEMTRVADGARAATQEVMFLHVDLHARRSVPFEARLRTRLAAAAECHAGVARPDWLGRRVGMRGPA